MYPKKRLWNSVIFVGLVLMLIPMTACNGENQDVARIPIIAATPDESVNTRATEIDEESLRTLIFWSDKVTKDANFGLNWPCPELDAATAEKLGEALTNAREMLNLYKVYLETGKDDSLKACEQVHSEISRKAEDKEYLEYWLAWQEYFHNISVALTDLADVVSVIETLEKRTFITESLESDEVLFAVLPEIDETIKLVRSKLTTAISLEQAFTGAMNTLDIGSDFVSETSINNPCDPGPENIVEFNLQPGNEDMLDWLTSHNNWEALGTMNSTAGNAISYLSGYLEYLETYKEMATGVRPKDLQKLKNLKFGARASAGQLVAGSLQLVSEHFLEEMQDRISELEKYMRAEEKTQFELWKTWRSYWQKYYLVVDAQASVEKARSALIEVTRGYKLQISDNATVEFQTGVGYGATD